MVSVIVKYIFFIRDKINNLSVPAKASIWFALSNILQKGIALITTPIFTRLLTTEQFGVYSIYMSWYSIIFIFATLNLSAGVYNKALVKFDEKEQVTSSFLGLSTIVTFCLGIIYLLNMPMWNDFFQLSTLFIVLILIECIFQPAYLLWSVGERFEYSYKRLVIITLLMALANPIVGVISVLFTEYKAEARVFSLVFVEVCVGVVFYVMIMRKGGNFFNDKYWKFALKFNLPLIPHYLSMTILNQVDRIMIGQMIGNGEVAIYSVAYTISSMMNLVTNAINNTFIPYTYKALKDDNYDDVKRNTNGLLILVGGLCVLTILFAPEVIWIVGGDQYVEAICIIPPVAVSVYFMFLYPLFGNIEFYYEKTSFVMIASCIGAMVNIALNYIFISQYGYVAAGYTTLVCYILFSFAHYLFYKKIIKEQKKTDVYDLKFVFVFSLIILLAMFVMVLSYKTTLIRYGIIILMFIIVLIKRKRIIDMTKKLMKK